LKLGRRGRPDIGLPEPEEPVDPDYGIEEGGGGGGDYPDIGLPTPPPGIWPPLTPEHPWLPLPDQGLPRPPGRPDQGLPPSGEHPEHPIVLPPGTVWPPLPPDVHGKYLALVLIGGGGRGAMYRYVVIDADAEHPSHPDHPGRPGRPDQGLPPTAGPKR
jgi:hypothetical protein